MSTFFDLKNNRSYKMTGPSTKRYAFYNGKPVEVAEASDIEKFRMHTDLFFECDKDGAAIAATDSKLAARSYSKFRPHIANRDEVINESAKLAAEQRKTEGVDVAALLKQVAKDAKTAGKTPKHDAKVKKVKKEVNPLECTLCGVVALDMEALKEHLDKHNEED